MKIIFLDIDGVLNSRAFENRYPPAQSVGLAPNDRWIEAIDPDAVTLLDTIVASSDARVVVSSTWRRGFSIEKLQDFLRTHGFEGEIIGATPNHAGIGVGRGGEIQAWLDEHPQVTAFVILDDNADMAHLADHLVQTNMSLGLCAEHVARALRLLNE